MQSSSVATNRPRVAVLIPKETRERIFTDVVVDELAAFAEPVIVADDQLAGESLSELLKDIPVAITGWKSPKLPIQSLAPKGSVVFVSHAAGSIKALDILGSLEAGHIRVSHAAPKIADAVAEFTLTQILAHLRRHTEMDAGLRAGKPWFDLRHNHLGQLLGAQDVGIVGLGYVGHLVLKLLRPFGCNVCVYDPFIDSAQAEQLGVTLLSLEDLFERCSVVSLHAANLPATEGMITTDHLERLQPGGLLVNTARAGLIEKGALLKVLQQGRIFAAIDTFDIEPLPDDDPLRQLRNIYLSPHCAGHTVESYVQQGLSAVEEVRLFLSGQTLKQEIIRERAAALA